MADELQQLRQAQGQKPKQTDAAQTASTSLVTDHLQINLASHVSPFNVSSRSAEKLDSIVLQTQENFTSVSPPADTFALRLQHFSSGEIDQRFRVFVEQFHPILPLLDTEIPKASLYVHSPFLFWVIVSIASRIDPFSDDRQLQLWQDVLEWSRTTATAQPMTLHSIQGLLLLAVWPMPVHHQFSDPAWQFCNVALGASAFLRLNRTPEAMLQGSNGLAASDINNMIRTWLAALCVSSTFSTWTAMETHVMHAADLALFDAQINYLPSSPLVFHADIARIAAKHFSLVKEDLDMTTEMTLVELSLAELDGLKRKHMLPAILPHHLDMLMEGTRLAFQASLLVAINRESHATFDNTADKKSQLTRQIMVGVRLASRVIECYDLILEGGINGAQSTPTRNYLVLPKKFYYMHQYSAFFLSRWGALSVTREADRVLSRVSMEKARDSLIRSSGWPCITKGHDEPARASRAMDMLLRDMLRTSETTGSTSGGRGSVVWDTIEDVKRLKGYPTHQSDMLRLINPCGTTQQLVDHDNLNLDLSGLDDIDISAFIPDLGDVSQVGQIGQLT